MRGFVQPYGVYAVVAGGNYLRSKSVEILSSFHCLSEFNLARSFCSIAWKASLPRINRSGGFVPIRRPFCEGPPIHSTYGLLLSRALQRLFIRTPCEAQPPIGPNCLYYESWILIHEFEGLRRMENSNISIMESQIVSFSAKNVRSPDTSFRGV